MNKQIVKIQNDCGEFYFPQTLKNGVFTNIHRNQDHAGFAFQSLSSLVETFPNFEGINVVTLQNYDRYTFRL